MTRRKDEAALLEAIQDDLPLVPRPFAALGERLGMPEKLVVERLRGFGDDGVIREISAILNGAALGFRSTLVALRVPERRIEQTAQLIGASAGVSHSYLREHEYSLWFTLAVPRGVDLGEAVTKLIGPGFHPDDVLLLPALRTYKLRVRLAVGDSIPATVARRSGRDDVSGPPGDHRGARVSPGKPSEELREIPLDASDRRLLALLERPLEPVPDLWAAIGRRAGLAEATVIESVDRWRRAGVIRRVSAVLRHRRVGYTANGMSCYALPGAPGLEAYDDAGSLAAAHPYVSHCYYRDADGRWRLPLFAMIHAGSRAECLGRAERIAGEIGARDHLVLFSTREFKKERVRYFEEEIDVTV